MQKNLQEQVNYYRARASEYDEWFYRINRYDRESEINQRWFNEVAVIKSALHQIGKFASVLELACGTGIWTAELLQVGEAIDAFDAAPEVIEINRNKLNSDRVNYRQIDLFSWEPDREYDNTEVVACKLDKNPVSLVECISLDRQGTIDL